MRETIQIFIMAYFAVMIAVIGVTLGNVYEILESIDRNLQTIQFKLGDK